MLDYLSKTQRKSIFSFLEWNRRTPKKGLLVTMTTLTREAPSPLLVEVAKVLGVYRPGTRRPHLLELVEASFRRLGLIEDVKEHFGSKFAYNNRELLHEQIMQFLEDLEDDERDDTDTPDVSVLVMILGNIKSPPPRAA